MPNRDGHAMTRDNVTKRLDTAVARAAKVFASLAKRRISPHTIRHYDGDASASVGRGLQRDCTLAWARNTTTTHRYVEADLEMKDKALTRLQEPDTKMPAISHMTL